MAADARSATPSRTETLMGPLIHEAAVEQHARGPRDRPKEQMGRDPLTGGGPVTRTATAAKASATSQPDHRGNAARTEGHADPQDRDLRPDPLHRRGRYDTSDEAIAIQNDVPQGLSSVVHLHDAISCRAPRRFLAASGSDCGIANVNIGTERRRDRRRLRWREGHWRRPGIRLRRLEGVYAATDTDGELFPRAAAGAGY